MYNEYLYKQPQMKKTFNYREHIPTINKIMNNMKTTKYEHFALYEEAFLKFYEELVSIHDNIQETPDTPETTDTDSDVIEFDLKHIKSTPKKKKQVTIMEILKGVNI